MSGSRSSEACAMCGGELPAPGDIHRTRGLPPPRTGDTVKHGPTGETWTVAYYDGQGLVPCGWPCTFARVEDCTIVERATDAESEDLLRKLAAIYEDDPRRRWRPCATCGKPGHRPQDHAGWNPTEEGHG